MTATERRELHFENLDEAVAEAERLAAGEVRTTGEHTLGQILEHLARTHDMATGKTAGPKLPFVMRLLMPLIKKKILNSPVRPGVKLPAKGEEFFWPQGDVDVNTALSHLRESVDNYNANGPLPVHPVFGKATREQIDRLNCGHCAMHLSFVHPLN
jgi:hypothetical protein